MGKVNQPSNLLDRIKRLERQVAEQYKKIGLQNARIDSGGLTLTNDAFFRMVDDMGFEIVYFGPDTNGKQIIRIRREGGSLVFYTAFTGGQQYWRLVDRFGMELFSDDTLTGGMASPWLSVPMYPLFSMAASSVYAYMNLPVASVVTETVLWRGRIPLVTHPFMSVSGIFGQASGSNSSTFNLKLGFPATTVGTWSETTVVDAIRGPFNVTAYMNLVQMPVQVTATATGTGNVGCQLFSLYQRQT